MKGKVVDGYRLLEQLHENDDETIYLAAARGGEGLVCLHIIAGKGRGEAFTSLMRDVQRLESPNILPVVDHGTTKWNSSYYVEPIVEGATLLALIESAGSLPWVTSAVLLHEITHAIEQAHAHGIGHGNLSAEQIQLEPNGQVRVRGFGAVAAFLGESDENVVTEATLFQRDIQSIGRLAKALIGVSGDTQPDVPVGYLELCDLEKAEDVDAKAVAALLERILGDMGVESIEEMLTRFSEEWSFFFLLNKTFFPSAETEGGQASTDGAEDLGLIPGEQPSQNVDEKWLGQETREDENDGIAPAPFENDKTEPASLMELEKDVPGLPAFMSDDFIEGEESPESFDGLQRLEEMNAAQAKRRHKRLVVMVFMGAVIAAFAIGFVFRETPSESELEERARKEIAEDLDAEHRRVRTPVVAEGKKERDEKLIALLDAVDADLEAGRLQEAQDRLSASEERLRMFPEVVIRRAALLRAEGNPEKAEALLLERLERSPDSSPLVVAVLQRYLAEKRWKEAHELVSSAQGRGMDDPIFLDVGAQVYREVGESKRELHTLIQLTKDHPTTQRRLRIGVLYEERQDWGKAAAVYRAISKDAPQTDAALWGLLRSVETIPFDRQGLKEVQEILKVVPDHVASQLYLAERFFARGEYARAVKHLKKFRAERPDIWEGLMLQAGLDLRRGDWSKAVVQYNSLRADRPDNPMIAHNLGVAYGKGNKTAQARTAFETAMRLDKTFWQPRCILAQMHHRAGRYAKAKALYAAASRIHKQHPWLKEIVPLKLDSPKAGYLLTEVCFGPEIIESPRYVTGRTRDAWNLIR